MTDYYIAKDGQNGTDRGTAESPARTVSYVIETLGAGTGDTLYFFAGTYSSELERGTENEVICNLSNRVIRLKKAPQTSGDVIFKPSNITNSSGEYKETLIAWSSLNNSISDVDLLDGIKITYTEGQNRNGYKPLFFSQGTRTNTFKIGFKNCVFDWDYPDAQTDGGNPLPFQENVAGFNFGDTVLRYVFDNCVFYSKNSAAIYNSFVKNDFTIQNCDFNVEFADPSETVPENMTLDYVVGLSSSATVDDDSNLVFSNNKISVRHGALSGGVSVISALNLTSTKFLGNKFSLKKYSGADENQDISMIYNVVSRPEKLFLNAIIDGNSFYTNAKRGVCIFTKASDSSLLTEKTVRIKNNILTYADSAPSTSAYGVKADYQLCDIYNNVFNNAAVAIRFYRTPAGAMVTNNKFLGISHPSGSSAYCVTFQHSKSALVEENEFEFNFADGEGSYAIKTAQEGGESSDGMIVKNNNFIIQQQLSANETRMYSFNSGTGIQHKNGGSDDLGRSAWFLNNTYENINLLNSPSTFASIAYQTDSTITAADWKTNFEPTANYNPPQITFDLTRSVSKALRNNRISGKKKDFYVSPHFSDELITNGGFRSLNRVSGVFAEDISSWTANANATLDYDSTFLGLRVTNTGIYGRAYQQVTLVEGGLYRIIAVCEEDVTGNALVLIGSTAGNNFHYQGSAAFSELLVDDTFIAKSTTGYVQLLAHSSTTGASTTWSYVSLRRIG